MARVTIIFDDGDEPNQVRTHAVFDPPVEANAPMTPAQQCGLSLLEKLREMDGDDTDLDDE